MDGTRNSGSSAERDAAEEFGAFYDFAFPRVYRFAWRRMGDEARAQALCRLVLIHALTALGGIEALETGRLADPTESATWLYSLARRVAEQVEEKPELLEDLSGAADLDASRSLLPLATPRSVAPMNPSPMAAGKISSKSS